MANLRICVLPYHAHSEERRQYIGNYIRENMMAVVRDNARRLLVDDCESDECMVESILWAYDAVYLNTIEAAIYRPHELDYVLILTGGPETSSGDDPTVSYRDFTIMAELLQLDNPHNLFVELLEWAKEDLLLGAVKYPSDRKSSDED